MRIGIYGGSFDPPHIGHEHILRSFLVQVELDVVYVMPAFLPPHKQSITGTSPETRLEMSKLAFSKISNKIVVSDLEIKRQGVSYTADTIKHFVSEGNNEVFLLCGTDMFITLDEWRNPSYIFENATIVHAIRENRVDGQRVIIQKKNDYINRFNAKVLSLKIDAIELSSSQIRDMINLGDSRVEKFVSKEVLKLIEYKELYKNR